MEIGCLSCDIKCKTRDELQAHHATRWHHYNLIRVYLKFPPITFEAFDKEISISKDTVGLKRSVYCKACRKTFANDESYNNHSKSKQHNLKLNKSGITKDDAYTTANKNPTANKIVHPTYLSEDYDESSIPINHCLFCAMKFDTMEQSLMHMGKCHSFYIPDIEYCVDVEEFLDYLGAKVGTLSRCIFCNRHFGVLSALQKHMSDKWHMRIDIDGEKLLEYSDLYDYSSTYPDAEEANPDEEVSPTIIMPSETFQLVLPSGTVVGHKALVHYCSQTSNIRSLTVANTTTNKLCVKKMSGYYKSIGWEGASKAQLKRRSKDIKAAAEIRSKMKLNLGIKHNKFQPHYRVQIDY